MSFLSSRSKLPISTVVAAAQSLYVLTDDNQTAIDDVRSDPAYGPCLFDIVKCDKHHGKGDRHETLRVLCCGEILCVQMWSCMAQRESQAS